MKLARSSHGSSRSSDRCLAVSCGAGPVASRGFQAGLPRLASLGSDLAWQLADKSAGAAAPPQH